MALFYGRLSELSVVHRMRLQWCACTRYRIILCPVSRGIPKHIIQSYKIVSHQVAMANTSLFAEALAYWGQSRLLLKLRLSEVFQKPPASPTIEIEVYFKGFLHSGVRALSSGIGRYGRGAHHEMSFEKDFRFRSLHVLYV